MPVLLRRLAPAIGYAVLATALTWPLPLHLATRLTGSPGGDTGVYVWNLWIFRHELIRHAQWPFLTNHIFALSNGTELSVHNYTVFADLLALPLIGQLGVVASFNLIYLFLIASSGYTAFLLIKRLVGGRVEAWIAGAAFAASPFLIARGTAHFSLVAAAPLPAFLLCLMHVLDTGRRRDAMALGLVIGWAGYCDVYYPMYCLVMGIVVLAHRQWRVEPRHTRVRHRVAIRCVNGLLVCGVLVVSWRVWHGPSEVTLFGNAVSLRTLYTPILTLTLLSLVRAYFALPYRVTQRPEGLTWRTLFRLIASMSVTALLVLSPIVVGLATRILDGRFPSTPIRWRSSPPGLDLLELFIPNPNHPWFGAPAVRWITTTPLDFPEHIGSVSLVMLGVIGFTIWRIRRAVPTFWIAFTVVFAFLSLGPFVHVGHVNTYVPGPWALLRYVPVLGLARSPARFAVIVALGASIMFGYSLAALRQRWPLKWPLVLPALAAVLTFELLPVPRPLFDAVVPAIYARVRANSDESVRMLELPGGVRDGTSSIGDFSASSQFFQTSHRKPLLGGYQSRVSEWRKGAEMDVPVMAALYRLSEHAGIPDELAARARATSRQFIEANSLGYVMIDRRRASPELRRFAIETLGLIRVASDGERDLYVPTRAGSPR